MEGKAYAGGAPGSDVEADADRVCLARVMDGETDVFGRLVERYATRVYAHLYSMVRHRQEAEDLAQETFSRAYRSLHTVDVNRPFRSWLYAIATNAGLNALRARRRRREVVALDEVDGAPCVAPGQVVQPLGDSGEDLTKRVGRAVERLPKRAALLVHLHYYEGMSIREAAETIGMTENAAKVALHRARTCLREWLVEGEVPPVFGDGEEET